MARWFSLAGAFFAVSAIAKEPSFVLNSDHESFTWREQAGRPTPSLKKAVLWTRHEQVHRGAGTLAPTCAARASRCGPVHAFCLLAHPQSLAANILARAHRASVNSLRLGWHWQRAWRLRKSDARRPHGRPTARHTLAHLSKVLRCRRVRDARASRRRVSRVGRPVAGRTAAPM